MRYLCNFRQLWVNTPGEVKKLISPSEVSGQVDSSITSGVADHVYNYMWYYVPTGIAVVTGAVTWAIWYFKSKGNVAAESRGGGLAALAAAAVAGGVNQLGDQPGSLGVMQQLHNVPQQLGRIEEALLVLTRQGQTKVEADEKIDEEAVVVLPDHGIPASTSSQEAPQAVDIFAHKTAAPLPPPIQGAGQAGKLDEILKLVKQLQAFVRQGREMTSSVSEGPEEPGAVETLLIARATRRSAQPPGGSGAALAAGAVGELVAETTDLTPNGGKDLKKGLRKTGRSLVEFVTKSVTPDKHTPSKKK